LQTSVAGCERLIHHPVLISAGSAGSIAKWNAGHNVPIPWFGINRKVRREGTEDTGLMIHNRVLTFLKSALIRVNPWQKN